MLASEVQGRGFARCLPHIAVLCGKVDGDGAAVELDGLERRHFSLRVRVGYVVETAWGVIVMGGTWCGVRCGIYTSDFGEVADLRFFTCRQRSGSPQAPRYMVT